MNRSIRTAGLSLVIAAVAAPLAYGHAEVTSLSPKSGSTVSRSLSAVTIRFSEAVLGGKLVVRSAGGRTVSSHSHLIDHKRGLRAAVSGLKAGRYSAKATWVADDGDKQSKAWSFKVH